MQAATCLTCTFLTDPSSLPQQSFSNSAAGLARQILSAWELADGPRFEAALRAAGRPDGSEERLDLLEAVAGELLTAWEESGNWPHLSRYQAHLFLLRHMAGIGQ